MAERVGFEPTVRRTYDGFQDRSVMTTSVSLRICLMILPHRIRIVKSFFEKIFILVLYFYFVVGVLIIRLKLTAENLRYNPGGFLIFKC